MKNIEFLKTLGIILQQQQEGFILICEIQTTLYTCLLASDIFLYKPFIPTYEALLVYYGHAVLQLLHVRTSWHVGSDNPYDDITVVAGKVWESIHSNVTSMYRRKLWKRNVLLRNFPIETTDGVTQIYLFGKRTNMTMSNIWQKYSCKMLPSGLVNLGVTWISH